MSNRRQCGTIRYAYEEFFTFEYIDVLNFEAKKIKSGLAVDFNLTKDRSGNTKAIDIYVFYPSSRRFINENDPVLHPVNWEENETHYLPEKQNIAPSENSVLDTKDTRSILLPEDYVALALFDRRIRLVSLTKDGEFRFLDQTNTSHNIFYPSIFEEISLQLAIEELESLINSPKSSEGDFQKFFESHPDFILNDDYKQAHSHIVLTDADDDKLIPDFILEPVNQNAFCDLLELKLHTPEVFILKKNRERYSAAVYEAAAQLREYSRFFDSEMNRSEFTKKYPHLKLYKPRMFVIIGRENTTASEFIKRQIQMDHPDLLLKTYDEIITRMKSKKVNLARRNEFFK